MFDEPGFVEGKLVRIFISEADRVGDSSLANAIVRCLRERGIAGASMFRGTEGFGGRGELHTNRFFAVHVDRPLLIEFVDLPAKVDAIVPAVEALVARCGGLIAVESLAYRHFPVSAAKDAR
jgi:PII-like signaling protein